MTHDQQLRMFDVMGQVAKIRNYITKNPETIMSYSLAHELKELFIELKKWEKSHYPWKEKNGKKPI